MIKLKKTCIMLVVALACGAVIARAQTTQSQPVTDSSAQASPATPPPKAVPADDTAAEDSPVSPTTRRAGSRIAARTAIHVTLTEGIDSARLKNGQTVHAKVSSAVSSHGHLALAAGTHAELTVIATLPAGKVNAVGEMSLQLIRVGNQTVDTDVLTFRGQPGHRDLPDSAPAIGTNAGLGSGAALTFHVRPAPTAAIDPPKHGGTTPGSVTGVAKGSQGTPQKQNGGEQATGTGDITSGQTPARVAPPNNQPNAPGAAGTPANGNSSATPTPH